MSKGIACKCPGTRKDKMKNWTILQYKSNQSAFSGYKTTPSDYSSLRCTKCNSIWRTKSPYVDELINQNDKEVKLLKEYPEVPANITVLFLLEQDSEDQVFAFFPDEKYDDRVNMRTCYAHVGQHSACSIDYVAVCEEATPEQYKDLLAELRNIGYQPIIKNSNKN